jgi:methyl-accepting chemotaxis protein
MALVGEAHIIVKAITTGVEKDIRNGFQNLEGIGTEAGDKLGKGYGKGFSKGFINSKSTSMLGKLSDGFKSSGEAADAAKDKFAALVKTSHYVDAAVASIGGTIGQLVYSVGALGGAVAGAAASGVTLINVFASVKTGLGIAKLALGGVGQAAQQAATSSAYYGMTTEAVRNQLQKLKYDAIDAALGVTGASIQLQKARIALTHTKYLPNSSLAKQEAVLALQQAQNNLNKAQDANKQAQKAAKRGSPLVTKDPYAGLTKSQAAFAKYLAGLRPVIMSIKETVAGAFLPQLRGAIDTLIKTSLPTIKTGFAQVGTTLGGVAKDFAVAFGTKENQKNLSTFFTNVSENIKPLGKILSNALTIFLNVLKASQPLTKELLKWVGDISDKLATWTGSNGKTMEDFFGSAGASAKKVGKIFNNLFTGFGTIIKENLKPGSGGQKLLDFFVQITKSFANIGKGPKAQKALSDTFKNAADGSIAFMKVLGGIGKMLLDMAANKNVTKFWNIILDNMPTLSKLFDSSMKALPTVAQILVDLGKGLAAIAESEGVVAFFKTLQTVLGVVANIMNTPAFKAFIRLAGPILAIASAIGILNRGFKFFGLVFRGYARSVGGFFRLLKTIRGTDEVKKITAAFNDTKLGSGIKRFKDSIGGAFKSLKTWAANTRIGKLFSNIKTGIDNSFPKAKKDSDKLGTSVESTEKHLFKMNKQVSLTEKAFRGMNKAIEASNKLISALKTKLSTATTALGKFRSAAGTADTKVKALKTSSKTAADKLDAIRKKADSARVALGKLGRTKAMPTVGTKSGGGGGGGGIGGFMPSFGGGFLGRAAGGAAAAEGGAAAAGGLAAEGSVLAGSSVGGPVGLAVGAVVAGTMVVGQAVAPLIEIADKSRTAETSLTLLAKIYGGLGKNAKATGIRINEMATKISTNTGISRDEIVATDQLLLKYPVLAKTADKVGGAFDKTSELSLDLSRALGIDGPSAAQIMADALSDPTNALDILRDANIKVTDEEKKKYKALLKSGKTAEAQAGLIKNLATTYDGSAKKMATTSDKIGAKWNELGGKIGKIFQPISDALANGLLSFLNWLTGGGTKVGATPTAKKGANGKMVYRDAAGKAISKKQYDALVKQMQTDINNTDLDFASGGTVYPKAGGTLARVAEAGRPERIEPLDPNGLSKRDIALITKMTGGAAAGMTINVYGAPGMDINDLADQVGRKVAFNLGRGKY